MTPTPEAMTLAEAMAEVERLTAHLHRIQKHPDYEYALTFEGNTSHKSMAGWEHNPHADAVYRHLYGQELYWMKRAELLPQFDGVVDGRRTQ